MAGLLDSTQLGEHLDRYRRSLFRMETLPEYAVDDDGDDFYRWVAGEAEPTWSRLGPWLEYLRGETAAGKVNTRVRVFSERLTDYERYACEWGYLHTSAAGEDIRVIHDGEHAIPEWLGPGDWWLVDNAEVVAMRYASDGRFEGAEILPGTVVGAYRDSRDAAWRIAEPFNAWWARHPELHRRVTA